MDLARPGIDRRPRERQRLPNAPYTSIPTNILFFDRSQQTQDVWYDEHPLPEGRKNYTKTQPLRFEEFAPCVAWWRLREENQQAWKIPATELLASGCNLDRKNPRGKDDVTHLPPEQLVESILEKERRIIEIVERIKAQLAQPT
jgi:type I restriction enzyme M protein